MWFHRWTARSTGYKSISSGSKRAETKLFQKQPPDKTCRLPRWRRLYAVEFLPAATWNSTFGCKMGIAKQTTMWKRLNKWHNSNSLEVTSWKRQWRNWDCLEINMQSGTFEEVINLNSIPNSNCYKIYSTYYFFGDSQSWKRCRSVFAGTSNLRHISSKY